MDVLRVCRDSLKGLFSVLEDLKLYRVEEFSSDFRA